MKTTTITAGLLVSIISLTACSNAEQHSDDKTTSVQENSAAKNLQPAKLFADLPDYCPTPDAFDIAPDGSLTLSCPNFADKQQSGVLVKITKDGQISKLLDVPVQEKSGKAQPMGIAYGNDGALYVCDNQGNGQLMRLVFEGNNLLSTEIIAHGFKSINGIRFWDGALYVTQSNLPKFGTETLTSGLYRFLTTDRDIKVNNDSTDSNLIYTQQTQNPDRQVGLDGLVFNKDGDLFVGNLGDATITKLVLSSDGIVKSSKLFAQLPKNSGPDGINIDSIGNLYAAGFSQNQIFKITPSTKVSLIAEYPDNDGSAGGLDQPADLIVYDGKLVISNFDLMVTKGMLNSKHGTPYTLSYIAQ